jgi:alpha-ketoglutarate-dependent taurine dioxygenase
MARTLDIEPIDATFGAVVRGIKVAEADEATFRALYDAWLEYALLIFPGQYLKRAARGGAGARLLARAARHADEAAALRREKPRETQPISQQLEQTFNGWFAADDPRFGRWRGLSPQFPQICFRGGFRFFVTLAGLQDFLAFGLP